jgi:rare lipoprotein A
MPASRRLITLLLAACALPAPATAAAQSTTGGTAAPTGEEPMIATRHATLKGTVTFNGAFRAADAGRVVTVERFDPITGAWVALTSTSVAPEGRWTATWRADVAGRLRTRATLAPRAGDGEESLTVFSAAGFEATVTVYRTAVASWYGPGFYGRRTACGHRLTRTLLGVAHKTLPCGTEVALHYQGASIIVPVVDRGPYVRGRKWDLTGAAAKALDFKATDRIGAVAVG